jgi:hypothetical protein
LQNRSRRKELELPSNEVLQAHDGERLCTRLPRLGRCAASSPTIVAIAKHQEFLMYFGWEPLAASSPVGQEVIQVQLQFDVVIPNASEVVRNSWELVKKCERLDFCG